MLSVNIPSTIYLFLSMYLLNGPPPRHRSPAEQLLNCSYLTINHRIFGPYSLLCSVGCNCKPVIIRDVGTMRQGKYGRGHALPDFGRSVNAFSIRGEADYTHNITIHPPPDFQTFLRPCIMVVASNFSPRSICQAQSKFQGIKML